MKLPSLQTLWLAANKVALRFPLQLLLALLSTAIWWRMLDLDYNEARLTHQLGTLLAACNLTLTLLLASDLFCEVHAYSNSKKWIFRLISLAIGAALYFLLDPWTYLSDTFRIFLLAFAFHLLVAFAPYLGKSNLNGFWQYNKSLFLRFLTSAFYAGVLYAGLAIALVAIDGLFNVEIGYKAYMKLFACVSAGFTTIFFLAGVPADFSALEEDLSYPKGLKIFTQYVLIPLMTIYLAILLVYEVKIIVTWSLPKGLVSALILGYAVFGILSLLLIYPIKDKEGNGWMRFFSKFFYFMMIPLVILLLLAIGRRIGNYGITESRYILIALSIWLTVITGYFLIAKKQNIKLIPISLCILALLATYGPQSAFSISKFSQMARLGRLMKSTNKNDIAQRAKVVRYLVDRHGLITLQKFTKIDLTEIEEKINAKNKHDYATRGELTDTAFALLKVKDDIDWDNSEYISVEADDQGVLSISGYDALFSFNGSIADSVRTFNKMKFKIVQETKPKNEDIPKLIVKVGPVLHEFDLEKLVRSAYSDLETGKLKKADYASHYYPAAKMRFTQTAKNYNVAVVLSTISGNYNKVERKFENLSYSGYLLIKKN